MSEHVCGSTNTSTGEPCRQPVSGPEGVCWREGHQVQLGRPRHEIDLPSDPGEAIEKLAGYGLTRPEIADFLGLGSESTLRRRIKEDEALLNAYARGRSTYKQRTHKRLRDIAFGRHGELGMKDDERVPIGEQRKTLVWIEKSQFGASERHQLEHSGPGGGPIETETEHSFDLNELSTEELRLLKQLRQRAHVAGNGAGARG